MAEIASLGLKVDGVAGIEQATSALGGLSQASDKAEKSTDGLAKGSTKGAKAVDQLDKSSQSASRGVGSLAAAAASAGALIVASFSVNAIRAYADEWSDLQSMVGAATGDMSGAADSMTRLVDIANASYSPLAQTVEVYSRNVAVLRDLGKSSEEAADFTESLNNMLVLTATRGERATSVQNALSKAMAVGRLQADGLETVLANGGEVAAALAKELGTTVSGLRDAATQGRITGQVIADAIIKPLDDVTARAAEMPATVTDAFVRVNNNFTEFVGVIDKATGASSAFAEAVLWMADGFRELSSNQAFLDRLSAAVSALGTALQFAAYAGAAVLVGRLAAATVAMGAQTVAAIANAAALGRAGIAAQATAAANTAMAATARAASAAMTLMGGPIGVIVTLAAGFALAVSDIGGKSRDASGDVDLLTRSLEGLRLEQAETLRFNLEEAIERAGEAAKDAGSMFNLAENDYAALKAQFESGRGGITDREMRNVEQATRDAKEEFVQATDRVDQLRARLAEVNGAINDIKNSADGVAPAVDKMGGKLAEWMAKYATQAEKLEATLARAREDFGGVIPEDLERRIRLSYETKTPKTTGGTGARSDPGAQYLKQMQERIALMGQETELAQLKAKIELGAIQFKTQAQQDEALAQAQTLDFLREQESIYEEIQRKRERIGSGQDADDYIMGDVSPLSGGAFDNQLMRYEAEAEAEEKRYADQLRRLEEARELQLETNASYDELEAEAARTHADRMRQIQVASSMVLLGTAENAFGAVAQVVKNSQGEQSSAYKAMFAASKAFGLASSAISLGVAIGKAWELPWPANIAGVAVAGAAMLSNIASIQSTGLTGMAHSGMDSVPETGTWLLEKGERVTTANTSARLDGVLARIEAGQMSGNASSSTNGMGGTTPNVTVNIQNAPEGTRVQQRQVSDEEYIIDVMLGDAQNAGRFTQYNQAAFGLERVGA